MSCCLQPGSVLRWLMVCPRYAVCFLLGSVLPSVLEKQGKIRGCGLRTLITSYDGTVSPERYALRSSFKALNSSDSYTRLALR